MPLHPADLRGRYRGRSGSPPQITIQQRGTLAINGAARDVLGRPAAVELLFDAGRSMLGLRPVADTAANAYPLRGAGGAPGRYLIAGRAFTEYHDIATDVTRRWDAECQGDVLFVDLTTPGVEFAVRGRGGRARWFDPRSCRPGAARPGQ